jgi:hypothetical protein
MTIQQYVIEAVGTANDLFPRQKPTYVSYYNPDGSEGRGDVELTSWISQALRFNTPEEAWAFWNQQSTVRPLREDGEPNKPLTALTIQISPYHSFGPKGDPHE